LFPDIILKILPPHKKIINPENALQIHLKEYIKTKILIIIAVK